MIATLPVRLHCSVCAVTTDADPPITSCATCGGSLAVAGLSEARRQLAETYIPFAYRESLRRANRIASHPAVTTQLAEDFAAEAMASLCRAALLFDPAKGYVFGTYAGTAIRHSLNSSAATAARTAGRRHVSLETIFGDCEPGECGISDPAADEAEEAERLAVRIEGWLRRLPAGRRKVMRLYYFDGLTLAEIGRQLGMCRERARQIKKDALERIRGMIERGL